MVSNWQLWLSPRPVNRTNTFAQEYTITGGDTVRYDFQQEANGLRSVKETHDFAKAAVRAGLSGPPLHIHLRQTETFQVEQGVLGVVKNGREYALTKDDGLFIIEPGVRHRFWAHKTSKEDLVFRVWASPQDLDHGFDEAFMRNFSSYLKDCETQGVPPSIFQILLFLIHSDILLTPPFWLPIWLLVALHHVFAYWVGAGLLGYQTAYPEYSGNPHDVKAETKKSA